MDKKDLSPSINKTRKQMLKLQTTRTASVAANTPSPVRAWKLKESSSKSGLRTPISR